jgi:hypothetical protein
VKSVNTIATGKPYDPDDAKDRFAGRAPGRGTERLKTLFKGRSMMKKNISRAFTFCWLSLGVVAVSYAATGTPIQVGTVYNFSQAPQSTVRYQLTVPYPGEFTLKISGWLSTMNWDDDYDRIYIYNDTLAAIGIGAFGTSADPYLFHMFQTDSTGMVFRVGLAGTYYIDVHSGQSYQWGTATGQNYSLVLTAVYCNDVYEPNNDSANATSIDIGQKITAYQWNRQKSGQVSGDEDWYKITIPSPGRLSIQLVNWVGTNDWTADYDRLYVLNGNFKSIGFAGGYQFYSWMMGGGTDSAPVKISMNLTHASTYYLHFHSGAGTGVTPYTLTTSFNPINDPFEPNDTFSTATLISCDSTYNAWEWRSSDSTMNVSGDEDYYYFHAPKAGVYSLTLKNWIGIYDWDADYDRLWVYDSTKAVVGANPYDWMMGKGTPTAITIPAEGKYYLRLHCGNTFSADGYTLVLNSPGLSIKKPSYPGLKNTFEITSTIKVELAQPGYTTLKVYDVSGREVATLLSRTLSAGSHVVALDPSRFSNKIFFFKLESGAFKQIKKASFLL